MVDYLKAASKLDDTDAAAKLGFFFKHLDSTDPTIAADAFFEFARASDADIIKAAKQIDAAKIRKLIADAKTPPSGSASSRSCSASPAAATDAAFLARHAQARTRSPNAPRPPSAGSSRATSCSRRKTAGPSRPACSADAKRSVLRAALGDQHRAVPAIDARRRLQGRGAEVLCRAVCRTATSPIRPSKTCAAGATGTSRATCWRSSPKPTHAAPIVRRCIVRYALCCPERRGEAVRRGREADRPEARPRRGRDARTATHPVSRSKKQPVITTSEAPQIDDRHGIRPRRVHADWLVVGVWADRTVQRPDSTATGVVAKLREAGDLTGKHLELVPVLNPTGIAAKRLLLVGLGKRARRDARHDPRRRGGRGAVTSPAKKVGTIAFAVPSPEFTLAVGVGLAQGCQGPGIRKTTPTRFAPDHVAAARRRRGRPAARAGRGRGAVARARTGERAAVRPLPGDVRGRRRRLRTRSRLRGRSLGRIAARGRADGLAARRRARFDTRRRDSRSCATPATPAARRSASSARA